MSGSILAGAAQFPRYQKDQTKSYNIRHERRNPRGGGTTLAPPTPWSTTNIRWDFLACNPREGVPILAGADPDHPIRSHLGQLRIFEDWGAPARIAPPTRGRPNGFVAAQGVGGAGWGRAALMSLLLLSTPPGANPCVVPRVASSQGGWLPSLAVTRGPKGLARGKAIAARSTSEQPC